MIRQLAKKHARKQKDIQRDWGGEQGVHSLPVEMAGGIKKVWVVIWLLWIPLTTHQPSVLTTARELSDRKIHES
jgi:hypothetical protein